jgi:D-alanyl-lipoteichoic acid acyltransferase DltB (MBOAT superfamily)
MAKWHLALGIAANLLLLGYYKYAGFFGRIVQNSAGVDLGLGGVVLPIGISFFTFTQIAYLVDAQRGLTKEYDPIRYGLFVSYFPHLVAGPILHHREMMQQFVKPGAFRFSSLDLAVGTALFLIGLGKKVLLADSIAPVADSVFGLGKETSLTMAEAWIGVFAYTLQIYFDFSGYSDMALGLARMMGVRMPLNFNSPYKATSIIDFWRRWHMTLSRFLRDYLYIPLGGNRKGQARRYLNIFITMLLGGLWHGAEWTFIVWGGLHGLYLAINHAWQAIFTGPGNRLSRFAGWAVTFIAVVVGWVFFRANSLETAFGMMQSMFGGNGIPLPTHIVAWLRKFSGHEFYAAPVFENALFRPAETLMILGAMLALALLPPNSQEILALYEPALDKIKAPSAQFAWRPNVAWGVILGALFVACITRMGGESPFLYFRF